MNKPVIMVFLVLLCPVGAVLGQQSGGMKISIQGGETGQGAKEKDPQTSQAQKGEKKPLTNADVVSMVKAGLAESTIVLAIQRSTTDFDTSAAALISLKNQCVPQKVLDAMLGGGTEKATASAGPTDGAPATSPPTKGASAAQGQDATAMEEQYKTCAKHYIPADKCTPEIYSKLKDRDNAPLDPNVVLALRAVKEYQKKLKNPASMQVHTAYITDKGDVCLEVGGQNTLGGQTMDGLKWMERGVT